MNPPTWPPAWLESLAIVGIALAAVAVALISWLAWRQGGCVGCALAWLRLLAGGDAGPPTGRGDRGGFGGGGGFGVGAGRGPR